MDNERGEEEEEEGRGRGKIMVELSVYIISPVIKQNRRIGNDLSNIDCLIASINNNIGIQKFKVNSL